VTSYITLTRYSETLLSTTLRWDQDLTLHLCASIHEALLFTCSYLEAMKMNDDLFHSGGEIIIHLLTDAARLLFALDVHKVIEGRSSSTPYDGLLARVAFITLTTRCEDFSDNNTRDFNHMHQCQDAMLQLLMDGPSELMERLIELDVCSMASSDYHEKTRNVQPTIIGSEEHHRYTDKSYSMKCNRYALVPALLVILDRLLLTDHHRPYSSSSSSRRDNECSSTCPILVSSLLPLYDDMMRLHSNAMIYHHRQLNRPCF